MPSSEQPTLRDLKRARTRRAIVEAGARLFAEHGYNETTVADIAAAAEIGKRTFFDYFDSKEQLLFPDRDARVHAALHAIEERAADEAPVDVLLRTLGDVSRDTDMTDDLARLRLRLARDVPAVQSRLLRVQLESQREITDALASAYPSADRVALAALVGAFVGAISAAVAALPTPRSADADALALQQIVKAALGRA